MASNNNTSFPKNKIKILLLEGVSESAVQLIQKETFQVECIKGKLGVDELKEKISTVHAVGIRSSTKLTEEVLAHAKRLLCIGCFCIGTNQVDLEAAQKRGIPVFNSPFCNTRSVAELVIAQIISLARCLGEKNKELHAGIWNKVCTSLFHCVVLLFFKEYTLENTLQSSKNCHEIRGKTLGIIGYGHIGSQLSVLAEAMGMRVIFYDIIPKLSLGLSRSCSSLEELLQEADFVTCHVPETPETKNMIGEKEIGMMKPGSYLLNASRGTVVVIPALAEALRSGHLAGAYVDVYPTEPLEYTKEWECELRNLPNTILTPHIGGSTEEAQESIGVDVASKIVNFINQGSTIAAVNFPTLELSYAGPRTHRILNIHQNVPGVLRSINTILSEFNVTRQILGTDGAVGYLIVEVDREASKVIKKAISDLPQSIRTRVLF
ncbi:phosphoglycerate dehydrogenase [Balamuthia mandrillaris]